jgi:hypothetical protein
MLFFSSRFAVDWAAVPTSPYDLSTSPQHETFRPPLKTNFANPIILGFKHLDCGDAHRLGCAAGAQSGTQRRHERKCSLSKGPEPM